MSYIEMAQKILDERQPGGTVLHVAEYGSTAWKMDSPGSDRDIFFLYVMPLDYYLAVNSANKTDAVIAQGSEVEWHGWELRKTLGLLAKSNPRCFEILKDAKQTPFVAAYTALAKRHFNSRKTAFAYWGQARQELKRAGQTDGNLDKQVKYIITALLHLVLIKSIHYTGFEYTRYKTFSWLNVIQFVSRQYYRDLLGLLLNIKRGVHEASGYEEEIELCLELGEALLESWHPEKLFENYDEASLPTHDLDRFLMRTVMEHQLGY